MFKEKLTTLFVTNNNHLNIMGADVMDQLGIYANKIAYLLQILCAARTFNVFYYVL